MADYNTLDDGSATVQAAPKTIRIDRNDCDEVNAAYPDDEFGFYCEDQFEETYQRLIKDDLRRARENYNLRKLENLTDENLRGIWFDTWRHWHCGYLENWILTKSRAEWQCGTYVDKKTGERKHLPPPSRRIIVPTPSMNHFNAIALATDRKTMDKDFWKQHAGEKELFYDQTLHKAKIALVFEGEVDAMSVWQACCFKISEPEFSPVAILGCSNWKKTLLPNLNTLLRGKKILLVLDGDERGRKSAAELRKDLIQRRTPTVTKFLYDALSEADQKLFGIKVDANDLLIKRGEEFLRDLINKIVAEAQVEFDAAQQEIDSQNLFANRDDRQSQSSQPKKPVTEADKPTVTNLLKFVKARNLSREEWLSVGIIMKYAGFTLDDFKKWSDDGDYRYSAETCSREWNTVKPAAQLGDDKGYTLGTLVKLAKQGGYAPPHEKKTPTADDFKTGDATVDEWQRQFGVIDKQVYLEICAAKKFLTELTTETLTAAVARSKSTLYKVALCSYYDFALDAVDKFFATLDDAKSRAAAQVKESKSGLVADVSADVRMMAALPVSEIRKSLAPFVTTIRKAHDKFTNHLKAQAATEKAQKAIADRRNAQSQKLTELETLSKQTQSDDRDARIVELIRDACEGNENPFSGYRSIRNSAANAKLIFTYDPILNGLTGFDEFQQAEVFLKKPPWRKSLSAGGEIFKDSDAAHVRIHLRETYDEFGSVQLVDDELTVFSRKRSFHPVKEYFRALPNWDGKPRAETIFIDFLRVDDTPFAREVTLNWLLGAMARIVYPGCPYQTALVLHGPQGIGKSYILERLGVDWFGVLNDNVDDPHAIDDIQNLWIVEMREFKTRKADVNSLKSFIDTAEDNRRAAFARRAERVKRHVVIGITVNDDGFLNDLTGNRRFPILECKCLPGKYIEGLTDEFIAQVWAEVKFKFTELLTDGKGNKIHDLKLVGKKLELSREAKRQVEAVAEKFLRDDGVANEIKGFLDTRIPPLLIWHLLSREERRRFFVDKHICFSGGVSELFMRRRARGGRRDVVNADLDCINDMFKDSATNKFFKFSDGLLTVYGCELRQHICAAEIRSECFAPTDKRNSMTRINELLPTIEGFHLGDRLQNADPAYPDQKKPFYRDNTPTDDDTPDTSEKDDFIGDPIDPNDVPPFNPDDPPF